MRMEAGGRNREMRVEINICVCHRGCCCAKRAFLTCIHNYAIKYKSEDKKIRDEERKKEGRKHLQLRLNMVFGYDVHARTLFDL